MPHEICGCRMRWHLSTQPTSTLDNSSRNSVARGQSLGLAMKRRLIALDTYKGWHKIGYDVYERSQPLEKMNLTQLRKDWMNCRMVIRMLAGTLFCKSQVHAPRKSS